jgi:hypothetical protein
MTAQNAANQLAAGSCGCGCVLILAGVMVLGVLVLLAAMAGSAG